MERTVKNCALWDQWRRDQITDLIDQVRGMLRHQNKKIELSCATLPWPERSYFSSLQDWMKWVKDGHVDFIVNMNYTLDLALSEYLSRMALSLQSKGKVWIGLGPYLFKQDAQNFSKEMNTILLMKPEGIVLFSYDGLLKQPSLVQNLQKRLKRKS